MTTLPPGIEEDVKKAQQNLREKIRNEKRVINRFDPSSPEITDEIAAIMSDALHETVSAFVQTSHLPQNSKRRHMREAFVAFDLQQKLEQTETIRNYTGPHDEVVLSLLGTVARHAIDVTDKHTASGVVPEEYVELLTGISRSEIQKRHKYSQNKF